MQSIIVLMMRYLFQADSIFGESICLISLVYLLALTLKTQSHSTIRIAIDLVTIKHPMTINPGA